MLTIFYLFNNNNPLAELKKRIFNFSNRFVINFIHILKDIKSTDFANNSGKQSFSLFCIISDNHKLIA